VVPGAEGGVAHVAFTEEPAGRVRLFLTTVQMAKNGPHELSAIARPALPNSVGLHVLVQRLVGVQFAAYASPAAGRTDVDVGETLMMAPFADSSRPAA
jgi:hypothetical protein